MTADVQSQNKERLNSGACILVVEDDPNDALLLERSLQKVCDTVPIRRVCHGAEAMAYLRGEGQYSDRTLHPLPVMILLDLKMPVMDGMELLTWLKSNAPMETLPVVVLSGSGRLADIEQARKLKAAEYIVKPFDFEEWKAVAKRLVHRWLDLTQFSGSRVGSYL